MMIPTLDFFAPPPQRQAQPRPAPQPPRSVQMAVQPPRPAQPTPPPTVRMQSPEEPAPPVQVVAAHMTMPSPESLGVGGPRREASFDWSGVHRRLDQLGCSCFQLEQQGGGCKLVCLLPTGKPGQSHRIEVQAGEAAEAARLLLQQADAWVARK